MRSIVAVLALGSPLPLCSQVPRVDPTPIVTVAASAPDGSVLLERIVDADLLPGGGFVVADGGANTLRYFDAQGRPVATAGGSGAGPGEFRRLWGVEVCGLTVVGHDLVARRLVRFDRTGRYLGEVAIDPPLPTMVPLTCAAQQTLVGARTRLSTENAPDDPVMIANATIETRDSAGAMLMSIAVRSAAEMVRLGDGGGPRPLGYFLSVAPLGQDLVYGTGREPSVVVVRAGSQQRLALPLATMAVTPAARQAADLELLQQVPPALRSRIEALLATVPDPEQQPYYRRIHPAPNGTAWLEIAGAGAPRESWLVINRGGAIGTVASPVPGTLLAIASDRILLLERTDDGEQLLRVHLLRPQ